MFTSIFDTDKSGILKIFLFVYGIVLLTIGGCNDILKVNDTGAIQEGDLDNPQMKDLIINGARSEFQDAFINLSLTSAVFSGEAYIDHTNIDWRSFSLLSFDDGNAINLQLYTNLQQLRVSAEKGVQRLGSIIGDDKAARDLDVAMLQTYAGYSYTYLGENFCNAPIDMSKAYSSQELLQMGIEKFKAALQTTEQSGQDNGQATKIRSLANLGIARANLQLGNMDQAEEFAAKVPNDFEAWAYYSENSTRENNTWAQIANPGSDLWVSVGESYLNLNDPRITHTDSVYEGLNGNDIYPPYRPMEFQGWDPDNTDKFISRSTNVRFASGLEAQYIIAEAEGPTPQTAAFVNERRQAGNQSPETFSSDQDLMDELRDQRSRDLYLTGHRLADLRRYLSLYDINNFPSGNYPVGNEVYGDARCYIIPLEEKVSNPNL